VWFRINVGRDRNAEPRWLIPLICKAGGITKAEIGSIRIFDGDSRFQIAKDKAEAFGAAVKDKNENNTVITPAFGPEARAAPVHAHRPSGDPHAASKGKPFKPKWKDKGAHPGAAKFERSDHPKFEHAKSERASGSAALAVKLHGKDAPPFRKHDGEPHAEKRFEKPFSGKPAMKPYKAKKKQKKFSA